MSKSETGRWGRYGGRYTAEALWQPLEEIAQAFESARDDDAFGACFAQWLDQRLGRPTPLSTLERLSESCGGACIWVKREDLLEGGSFCGSLAMFYALLAERMQRTQLIGETSSGDFGVALGAAGAAFGMSVRIFMGREDMQHEPLRVAEMKRLGVQVEPVDDATRRRRGSGAEAMRSWLGAREQALYCTSMLTSPDPYPRLIAHALQIIGAEARVQALRQGFHPDFIIAPIGTGGFAAGLFDAFLEDDACQLVGVQAGGELQAHRHASSLVTGHVGIFQGTLSKVMQDEYGQLLKPYSIAGGLCSSGVGPQHAWWATHGDAIYLSINDAEAIDAQKKLARLEGLTVSLEAAHALSYAMRLARELTSDKNILVGLSGDGRRDLLRQPEREGEKR